MLPVAVERIAELLVQAQRERGEIREDVDDDTAPLPLMTVVLLLHRALVGSIIGRGGVLVKETQAASGVRVQVSNDVLPGSTEKPVTIVGTSGGLREAFKRLAVQVADSEGKGGTKVVLYVPTPSSLQSMDVHAVGGRGEVPGGGGMGGAGGGAYPYPTATHHRHAHPVGVRRHRDRQGWGDDQECEGGVGVQHQRLRMMRGG